MSKRFTTVGSMAILCAMGVATITCMAPTEEEEQVGVARQELHGCGGSTPYDVLITSGPTCGNSSTAISAGDQMDDNGASCTATVFEYTFDPTIGYTVALGPAHTQHSSTECTNSHYKFQKWTYNGSWAQNGSDVGYHGVWNSGSSTCSFSIDSGSVPNFTAGTKWRYILQAWESNTWNSNNYNDFKRVAVTLTALGC
jgi:hypothetical protein